MRLTSRKRTIRSVYKTYIDAIHIKKTDTGRMGIDSEGSGALEVVDTRDAVEERNEEMMNLPLQPNFYEKLANSVGM